MDIQNGLKDQCSCFGLFFVIEEVLAEVFNLNIFIYGRPFGSYHLAHKDIQKGEPIFPAMKLYLHSIVEKAYYKKGLLLEFPICQCVSLILTGWIPFLTRYL